MIKKQYLFGLFVLSLLFVSMYPADAKWFDVSLFFPKYNPDKDVCNNYATKSGTILGSIISYKDIFDILYGEGLIKCNDYRAKTPCEMGNQTWTDKNFISDKDTFKIELGKNFFEVDDKTICREKTPRELKIEFCSNL